MTVKRDRYGDVIQAARPSISQTVAIGAASASSAAFTVGTIGFYGDAGAYAGGSGTPNTPPTTQHVRLCSTVDCFVLFGPSPQTVTATNGMFLPASSPEYFWINPGDIVAVIQSTAAGSLFISECA
jgi:hypothetical protein